MWGAKESYPELGIHPVKQHHTPCSQKMDQRRVLLNNTTVILWSSLKGVDFLIARTREMGYLH